MHQEPTIMEEDENDMSDAFNDGKKDKSRGKQNRDENNRNNNNNHGLKIKNKFREPQTKRWNTDNPDTNGKSGIKDHFLNQQVIKVHLTASKSNHATDTDTDNNNKESTDD